MLTSMVELDNTGGGGSNQATIASTKTWPKAHLSQRTMSDLHYRIQLERAITAAKVQDATAAGSSDAEFCRLKARLLRALEHVRDTKTQQMLQKAGKRACKRAKPQVQPPHFGSMILYGSTLQQKEAKDLSRLMDMSKRRTSSASFRKRSMSILSDSVAMAKQREEEDVEMLAEQKEPFFLLHCPLFTMLLFALAIIVLGSVLFQAVDESIGAKPFYNVLTFCFQALGTIGWGDVRAGTAWGQLLCTVYTLFGVPMFFSALAMAGRTLVSELYTIDWLFLTCVVRPSRPDEPLVEQHMPLLKAVQWLVVHQFVGLLLYGELFKHYRPIQTLYFCMTSMATIGIGDFHPDAANLLEAAVAILFLGSGIGLLAPLLIGIAYHFQTLFFIRLRGWLLKRMRGE